MAALLPPLSAARRAAAGRRRAFEPSVPRHPKMGGTRAGCSGGRAPSCATSFARTIALVSLLFGFLSSSQELYSEAEIVVSRSLLPAGVPPVGPAPLGLSGGAGSLDVFSWQPFAAAAYEPRPSYRNLMALLGSPVHRVSHFWAPLAGTGGRQPAGVDSASLNVSAACARMGAALAGWGGNITAAIKFTPYAHTQDAGAVLAATAAALRACFGARLASVEFASEPDVSAFEGNFSGYVASVAAWGAALSAGLWDVGALAGSTWFANASAIAAAAGPALKRFCIHAYPLTNCQRPGDAAPTIPALLAVSSPPRTVADLRAFAAPAPILVCEANAVSCGGFDGVSNVFAAALYAIDAAVGSAAAGVAPYVWHGLGSSEQPVRYAVADLATPGADSCSVAPLFYGLWAAASALVPGSTFLDAALGAHNMSAPMTASSALLKFWALEAAPGGPLRVLLLNKAGGEAVLARVRPCDAGAVANVTRLRAPSLAAREGVSWGGRTLDGAADGVPVGAAVAEALPCTDGAFHVPLPNASAALLEVAALSASPSPAPAPASPSATPSLSGTRTASLSAGASPSRSPGSPVSATPSPRRSPAATPSPSARATLGNATGAALGSSAARLSATAIGALAATGFALAALLSLGVAVLRRKPPAAGSPQARQRPARERAASHRGAYLGDNFSVRNPAARPQRRT